MSETLIVNPAENVLTGGEAGCRKIAFFGNVCNNFYQAAQALRWVGIDAHLYVCKNEAVTSQPVSDNPDLADAMPDWIHTGYYLTKEAYRKPWKAPIVKELAKYDAVIVSGAPTLFSLFTGKPTFFFISGGDITVLPFPLRFRSRFKTFKKLRAYLWRAFWHRMALKRCKSILTVDFAEPYLNAAKRLGLSRKIRLINLPIVMDTSVFKPRPEYRYNPPNETIKRLQEQARFIVFHPARLMIKNDPALVDTGQWKQNDLFIRAFARFVQDNHASDAVLVMPDTPLSPDVNLAKDLVRELKIEANVQWIYPPEPRPFTRNELIEYYAVADVVANDFGVGWFGSITCEGLAMGCPVMNYINPKWLETFYPWHPILTANTLEDIASDLTRLYQDPNYRLELGRKGVEWIREFHSQERAALLYATEFEKLFADFGVGCLTSAR